MRTSIKCTIKNLVNEPGGQCNEDQIGADLLPLVSIVMGLSASQPTIKFLGDARR